MAPLQKAEDIGYTVSMINRWKQIFSRRVILVLFCTLVLSLALVGFNAYVSSKQGLPPEVVMMTTAVAQDLPVIDQTIVPHTEFALFALG
jgi:hypothetical protein